MYFYVLLLASLLTVEKLAVKRESSAQIFSTDNLKQEFLTNSDLGTEALSAIQPNGDVEHIMLTKAQYEELKSGGTIKLGHNIRLRAKAVPS